ncbi:MAG: two-component system, LuxR family, sensor kinase FixL [Caballeronia sp.]|jgi:two-component system sensor kinase FixL|nr:two-component system, LuxR family, sensor kinase FixL [Caballeronia sp.]
MTVFAVCGVVIFIVLLSFVKIRRLIPKGAPNDLASHLQRLKPAPNNYVFAYEGGGMDADPAFNMRSEHADIRQTASFRKPREAGRSFIRVPFRRFKPQRLLRAQLSGDPPKNPDKIWSDSPTLGRKEARPLHDDDPFSCALDLLPLAVIVADPNGEIVFVNVAAGELFGYPVEDLIGSNTIKLGDALKSPWPFADSLFDASGRHAEGEKSVREVVAIRKDGVEFPVEISIKHISGPTGAYSLSIVMDRTERNELARHRQQLAHLTRVSTLGELAGSLAHELNQPLTAILSNAQAAQRFLTAEPVNLVEMREILHDLVQDTHRASEVIKRIRALVKKGEIETAPLSVAGVIRDVVVLVHSDAIVRGIRVVVITAPELPPVQGDRVQLQQVVLNLLLNAFDAMESCSLPGRVVSIQSSVDPSGEIRIAVRDGGTGISRDTVSRLFTPFCTSKRDGLGLGLSISRSIVEMHGGRIWAENNNDRGATFYFTLPIGNPPGSVPSRVAP